MSKRSEPQPSKLLFIPKLPLYTTEDEVREAINLICPSVSIIEVSISTKKQMCFIELPGIHEANVVIESCNGELTINNQTVNLLFSRKSNFSDIHQHRRTSYCCVLDIESFPKNGVVTPTWISSVFLQSGFTIKDQRQFPGANDLKHYIFFEDEQTLETILDKQKIIVDAPPCTFVLSSPPRRENTRVKREEVTPKQRREARFQEPKKAENIISAWSTVTTSLDSCWTDNTLVELTNMDPTHISSIEDIYILTSLFCDVRAIKTMTTRGCAIVKLNSAQDAKKFVDSVHDRVLFGYRIKACVSKDTNIKVAGDRNVPEHGNCDYFQTFPPNKNVDISPPGPVIFVKNIPLAVNDLERECGIPNGLLKNKIIKFGKEDKKEKYALLEFIDVDNAIEASIAITRFCALHGGKVSVSFSNKRTLDGGRRRERDSFEVKEEKKVIEELPDSGEMENWL